MKIKKILISQPKPEIERSPYFDIARNFGIEVHFRPFIQVEGIPAKEFRKHRIDILSYNAVIMTSKNAVDHYFRICNEMRIIVPETMKYFCISEATAYYLQKYIQFRKRKIFFSNFSFADLVEIIKKKHKEEKFLLPCAEDANEEYTELLDREGIRYIKAPLYKAVYSDLKDINFSEYDMLVLFSSAGITSLFNNFPGFKQHNTMIAAFGEQTAKAVIHAGLKLHIHAPQPQAPSMAMALDQFLRGEQKNQPWQQTPFDMEAVIRNEAMRKNFIPQGSKKSSELKSPIPIASGKPAAKLAKAAAVKPVKTETAKPAKEAVKPAKAQPKKPEPKKPDPKKIVAKKPAKAKAKPVAKKPVKKTPVAIKTGKKQHKPAPKKVAKKKPVKLSRKPVAKKKLAPKKVKKSSAGKSKRKR
jgi:uroporphyrinogen-III synthase